MIWTHPVTGKQYELYHSDELSADLAAFHAIVCPHEMIEVRRSIVGHGQIQYRNQCLDCGDLIGSAIAKAKVVLPVKDHDIELLNRVTLDRANAIAEIWLRHYWRQKERDSKWWKNYKQYLQTDQWKRKRELVLDRANQLCEGCRERPATEVHHLTYDRVFDEFLYDLVAMCDVCHAKCHPESEQDSDGEA